MSVFTEELYVYPWLGVSLSSLHQNMRPMQTCIVVVVTLVLACVAPGYTIVAIAAQSPCDAARGDSYITELKSSMDKLAELQRSNVDVIEFSQENIIRMAQGRSCLFIAPYEMLEVDGGNAVEHYISIFELTSEDPPIAELRKAAHRTRKRFALTGFYPIGVWGRLDWRRATISNNQVTVPAESLLCIRYKCCYGGPGTVVIDIRIVAGEVTTNVTDHYNGSDDPGRCH